MPKSVNCTHSATKDGNYSFMGYGVDIGALGTRARFSGMLLYLDIGTLTPE